MTRSARLGAITRAKAATTSGINVVLNVVAGFSPRSFKLSHDHGRISIPQSGKSRIRSADSGTIDRLTEDL